MIQTAPQNQLQQNEKQRINDLLIQDDMTNAQSDAYYRRAMAIIRNNLQAFYLQYANENGLSLAQTRHSVTAWDIQQWRRALQSVDMANWSDEAKFQGGKYSYMAGHDRTSMIHAITGIAVVDMIANMEQLVGDRLKADQVSQKAHLEQSLEQYLDKRVKVPIVYTIHPKVPPGTSFVTDAQDLWSSRLWLDSESMANDVQTLVNKHLRHGMSLQDLQETLDEHVNPKQFRPGQSLADRVKQVDYNTQRIVRTESARMIDETNMATYKMAGIKMVEWVTEPGACTKCQDIADGGPYTIDDCPAIPGDTHPNCRCSKIPFTN